MNKNNQLYKSLKSVRGLLTMVSFLLLLIACVNSKAGAKSVIDQEVNEGFISDNNPINTAGQLVNKDTIIVQETMLDEEQAAVEVVFLFQGKKHVLYDTLDVWPDYSTDIGGSVENQQYELYYRYSYLNGTSDETYTFGVRDNELILEEAVFNAEDRHMSSFTIMHPFIPITAFSEEKIMDLKEQAINFELPRIQRTGHIDMALAESIFKTCYEQNNTSQLQILTDKQTLSMLHGTFKEATDSEMYLPNVEHYNNIAFYLEEMGAEQAALEIQQNIDRVFPERKWGLLEVLKGNTGTLTSHELTDSMKFYVYKEGEQLFLANVNKGSFIKNEMLLKKEDENCVSDGFNHIVIEDLFFTIEQQTCESEVITNEFITFKMDTIANTAYLHKFEMEKIDERNSDNNVPLQTLTTADFGKISFTEVDIDKLYDLLNR